MRYLNLHTQSAGFLEHLFKLNESQLLNVEVVYHFKGS